MLRLKVRKTLLTESPPPWGDVMGGVVCGGLSFNTCLILAPLPFFNPLTSSNRSTVCPNSKLPELEYTATFIACIFFTVTFYLWQMKLAFSIEIT